MHIPRIGHEMIVDFPEGDPDRPIIKGRARLAARVGDMANCAGPPDTIAMGSTKVPICNMAWVRMGDSMAHGGVIVMGCPAVLIG